VEDTSLSTPPKLYASEEEARADNPELFAAADAKRKTEAAEQPVSTDWRAQKKAQPDRPEFVTKDMELASNDQRLRRNIQWGVVRGLLLYSLFVIPVVGILLAVLISGGR
jgi:hypothetical protein